MTIKTEAEWVEILTACGVRPQTGARWAPFFAAEIQDGTFSAGDADIDDFLGQVLHESSLLERLEENLYYTTASRICSVWPSRFPTVNDSAPYVRNPQALANRVYGGRLGNTAPSDGWRYRGSGPIQVTGKANFAALEKITGMPLVENPDLLRQPGCEALRVCIAWWEGHVPDSILGNITKVRRIVNGGEVGLSDTVMLTQKAKEALA